MDLCCLKIQRLHEIPYKCHHEQALLPCGVFQILWYHFPNKTPRLYEHVNCLSEKD